VYCCIHGCVCPCKCGKCCKGDDEIGVYEIKGNTNPSFIGDNASSKAPLHNHFHLPESTVANPAVWNDIGPDYASINYPNGTVRTEADAFDRTETVPRVYEKKTRSYASHDPQKHRSNRNEGTGRKRRSDHHRSHRSDKSHSPSKKQLNTLESEIKKLENEIENMKTDMNDVPVPAVPDFNSSVVSSVQAPLPQNSNTAIDALQLSDEEVDQPIRNKNGPYESRTVLVETPQIPQGQRTLPDTLQDRWRVPQLTVLPVDPNPIRQIDSSVI
jgi:hypothetical protein